MAKQKERKEEEKRTPPLKKREPYFIFHLLSFSSPALVERSRPCQGQFAPPAPALNNPPSTSSQTAEQRRRERERETGPCSRSTGVAVFNTGTTQRGDDSLRRLERVHPSMIVDRMGYYAGVGRRVITVSEERTV